MTSKLYIVLLHVFQPPEEAKSPELKEALEDCGFVYYLILARLYDIDPRLNSKDG
jgi:hypothetical protein